MWRAPPVFFINEEIAFQYNKVPEFFLAGLDDTRNQFCPPNHRVFFAFSIIPFLILTVAYKGAMTSSLSVSKPLEPFGECAKIYNNLLIFHKYQKDYYLP